MTFDRIVELCSAANDVEAYALRAALAEVGIDARVVGDVLEIASGMLPLGQATAPRIWVLASDEARARHLLDQWEARRHAEGDQAQEETDSPEADPEAEPASDLEEASDTDEPEESERDRPGYVIPLLGVAGMACIALGAFWAWQSWEKAERYSGTTEAVYAGLASLGLETAGTEPSPLADLPVQQQSRGSITFRSPDSKYVYEVNGQKYFLVLSGAAQRPSSIQVCYDPRNPGDWIRGPFSASWGAIGLVFLTGAFFWLLAYRFGRSPDA